MTISGPSDLAIAFRSLHRRLEEALGPVDGDRNVVGAEVNQLDQIIKEALDIVGVTGGAEDVARELEHRPADAWRSGQLEQLQQLTLHAGRVLRSVAEAAERHAEDRGSR